MPAVRRTGSARSDGRARIDHRADGYPPHGEQYSAERREVERRPPRARPKNSALGVSSSLTRFRMISLSSREGMIAIIDAASA